MLQRRALQLTIAIAALLPVVAGAWGILHGAPGAPSDTGWAANHHRYLSGLLLAIGLGYWSTLPRIDAMGPRLRLLTALVVVGGVARMWGVATGDALTAEVAVALAMELAVTPLICLWQSRVIATKTPVSKGFAHLEPQLRPIVP